MCIRDRYCVSQCCDIVHTVYRSVVTLFILCITVLLHYLFILCITVLWHCSYCVSVLWHCSYCVTQCCGIVHTVYHSVVALFRLCITVLCWASYFLWVNLHPDLITMVMLLFRPLLWRWWLRPTTTGRSSCQILPQERTFPGKSVSVFTSTGCCC